MNYALALVCFFLVSPLGLAKSEPTIIDYDKLDLTVIIKALRSGNHDPSGENIYYFVLTATALPILKEEVKKPLAERLKIERIVGEFGELPIKSLKIWQPDKKPNPHFAQSLSGDVIREITAETMRQFKVNEDGVSVLCRVEMFERSKKFGILGEDTKVGESDFPLIPESLPRKMQIENRDLVIVDELGTHVQLLVNFKYHEDPKKPEK